MPDDDRSIKESEDFKMTRLEQLMKEREKKKIKRIKVIRKVLYIFFACLMFLSAIYVIGTFGAYEHFTITTGLFLIRTLFGSVLFFSSMYLAWVFS